MGLVKLWSNLDFTKVVRQWTHVTIQEILAYYQEKLKSQSNTGTGFRVVVVQN